ncbi:hypothetical protein FOL47_001564 [Perkinsus chesapeaki]|uniref:Transmembrane protein n=1 Tax=Perkinsus chesapeaki TaxID=330153 RepID=A0A7J6MK58_PERCH|nr:hypothetical protein FOL47_001564 [Perkinsus chesapeaki]
MPHHLTGRRRRTHFVNSLFLSLWCITNGLQMADIPAVPSDTDTLLRHPQPGRGAPLDRISVGVSAEVPTTTTAAAGPVASKEFIPWVSLQPARIAYIGSGTLLDKRHRAWQHWAVITFSCLTALVIASHVVICVRSLCFESPGYGDHKQLASTEEGGLSSTQGGSSGGQGAGGGPRQHLQFDRFIINQGPESGYHMSQNASVDGPKAETIGRFHYMPDKGGHHQSGYGMREIIEDLSSDDYDSEEDTSDDADTRPHPAAGEIYFGLDGRARVVQYPQALLIPEEDETPEQFAARRKRQRERAHYAADTAGGPPRPWSRH